MTLQIPKGLFKLGPPKWHWPQSFRKEKLLLLGQRWDFHAKSLAWASRNGLREKMIRWSKAVLNLFCCVCWKKKRLSLSFSTRFGTSIFLRVLPTFLSRAYLEMLLTCFSCVVHEWVAKSVGNLLFVYAMLMLFEQNGKLRDTHFVCAKKSLANFHFRVRKVFHCSVCLVVIWFPKNPFNKKATNCVARNSMRVFFSVVGLWFWGLCSDLELGIESLFQILLTLSFLFVFFRRGPKSPMTLGFPICFVFLL